MKDVDAVFHFAANADVRFGTDKILKQNTIATFNVLEAMRLNNVKKILFSSTYQSMENLVRYQQKAHFPFKPHYMVPQN